MHKIYRTENIWKQQKHTTFLQRKLLRKNARETCTNWNKSTKRIKDIAAKRGENCRERYCLNMFCKMTSRLIIPFFLRTLLDFKGVLYSFCFLFFPLCCFLELPASFTRNKNQKKTLIWVFYRGDKFQATKIA